MEYTESRMQDQIEGALHSQQEAMERIAQLESDLATAEQDSRQKQARIERLEGMVKELREALEVAVRQNDYDMLMTGDELCSCAEILKNTEDA
jgi:chromosome segregation ATPase